MLRFLFVGIGNLKVTKHAGLNNGPPQAIPIFVQMEDTSVQVSHLWSPGGSHIWPRAPSLTSIMAQGDSNCGRILGS